MDASDLELLTLAARAAGLRVWYGGKEGFRLLERGVATHPWRPLENDGDALRLAVALNLLLMPYPDDKAVRVTRLDQPDTIVSWGTPPDPLAATRRAIVRAAAEIGKALAEQRSDA